MIHPHYPTAPEVDAWCAELLGGTEGLSLTAKKLDAPSYNYQLGVWHTFGNHYVAFESPGRRTFYGYWQQASATPAPVLFHLPGYGAEMSAHPQLVVEGFHVLHINPLGYCTPTGPGVGPEGRTVMPDTVRTEGRGGYVEWFADAILAVRWALGRDDVDGRRFAFFGTSQGGGTALILSSIFAQRGVRAAAADVPYLTNYPLALGKQDKGAYGTALNAMKTPGGSPGEWRALGFLDTLSHAHRLTMPVLLTAGSLDAVTPPDSIESLFEVLPGTKSYTFLLGQGHTYTMPFLELAKAWFRLYV